MAGIVYNGLRPLDLAHDKSDRTKIRGSVKTLTSIPYDYKDKNPGLFVDTGIQSTAELYSQDGSGKYFVLNYNRGTSGARIRSLKLKIAFNYLNANIQTPK